ncbi:MAG TPA: glycoside-pentoside-hexuronide (GPH):cation symporter [Patescibacteria group bacterium]|nr:glycoside-pentoside-hexuronide (GPH):cation symporter [Patescibacteria group bacterium]
MRFTEKVAYGLGNFGTQMIFTPAIEFVVYFYTDIVGIAPSLVGTLLFASQFLGLLNPVMGFLVDRTRTRFGKARPWILWMAVPFGIAAALLFRSPNISYTGKIIYALITYNLAFTLVYTPVDIPYSTMLPLMTTNQHERSSLNVFRMFLAYASILITLGFTLPLVKHFGGGEQGWGRTFLIYGAIATVSLLVCFAGTKERFQGPTQKTKSAVPLKVGIRALLRNKYLVILALFSVSAFLAIGVRIANLYYCRYFLHDASLYGPLMVMLVVSQMFTLMLTPAIVRRVGKRNAALGGLLVTVAGQLVLFITPLNFTVIAIGTVIKGLGRGPITGSTFAMVADALEFGEWKWHVRNDGLAFGAWALVNKATVGFSNAMVGWTLGLGGYVAGAAIQSASAMGTIKILFLDVPLVFYIVSCLMLVIYNLDRHYPQIEAELGQRRLATSSS